MRLLPLIPFALFVTGVGLLIASVVTGEGRLFLFLVFPGIVAGGILGVIGFLLIALSFVLGFAQAWRAMATPPRAGHEDWVAPPTEEPPTAAPEAEKPRRRFGGILLLGPIPIVFGGDRAITIAMVVVGIILTAGAVLLFLLLIH